MLFAEAAIDKLPGAPLFARANGSAWDKDAWKWPVKAAARAAALPTETTIYALRHSAITDLVTGGLDLLTVAQISGTSVRMIEDHYGSLRADHAAAALAGLAL
jgi:site-specific recombinase XerD